MIYIQDKLLKNEKNNIDYIYSNKKVISKVESYKNKNKFEYYLIQIADEDIDCIGSFFDDGIFLNQTYTFGNIIHGSQVDLIIPINENFNYELLCEKDFHVEAAQDVLIKISNKNHGN
jgi:hypothetical protein